MKVLITGACGFVGCSLAASLKEHLENLEIVGLDNLSRKGSETNVNRLKELGIPFTQGDVRNAKDLESLPPVDWVLDCAANPSVLAGTDGTVSSEEVVGHNLRGTLELLEYCRRHQAGFIILSTSRVYSIKALNRLTLQKHEKRFALDYKKCSEIQGISSKGIIESFPADPPLSLYGATKRASEIMALEYGELFSFPVWINRSSVIAGPGQFGKIDQGILSYWVYSYILGRPLRYIGYGGRGHQVRDFLNPCDLTELIVNQMKEPIKTEKPRVVNLGGGQGNSMSLSEMSEWCDDRSGKKKEIGCDPKDRLYDIPYYVTDSSLAKEVWGWKPVTSLENILKTTWEWTVKNKELIEDFF